MHMQAIVDEAGVQGDAIPDNTHIDLNELILPKQEHFHYMIQIQTLFQDTFYQSTM